MKKGWVVLFVFLLTLCLPITSFAQDNTKASVSVSSPISSTTESTGSEGYWTEDRMRDAEPMTMPGVAEPVKIMPPVPNPETSLPFGQNHFYTITLRGNGDALFSLKTVFSNREEASVSAIKFTFQKDPQNLSVYQVYREPQCISYQPMPLTSESDSMIYNYPPPTQKCDQYQEPDYSYGWGATTYHKAKFVLNGSELTVQLPKEVKPNGSGSLLLSFSMSGVTNKDMLGAYNFSVDTVKVADTIQSLQVGVIVDPDYYLKDAKGDINYQAKETSIAPMSAAVDEGRSAGNAQFDQFYNSIGQGTIVKSASNLQPNESYTVHGVYADSRWKLYGREIGVGIGIFVLVLVLAFGSLFIAVKKVFGKKDTPPDQPSNLRTLSYMVVLGASFGASLLILLYTIGLYILSYYFVQVFQYYSYNFFYSLLILLFAVISLCIYAMFLFAPGIIVGIKKGIIAGSATLILTIFWLVFYGIVFALIFFIFFQDRQTPPYPYPVSSGGALMERGAVPPDQPVVDK